MVILYVYLHTCITKTQFYRTDTQIKKIETVCEGKTFAHRPMRICISVYSLMKSQPEKTKLRIVFYLQKGVGYGMEMDSYKSRILDGVLVQT
jgi:hypothetical protein